MNDVRNYLSKERKVTNMELLKQKLTSRKLWLSIAAFVSMLMVYKGADTNSAEAVSALIVAGGTVIAYVLGEGLVDAAGKVADTETLIELLEGEEEE